LQTGVENNFGMTKSRFFRHPLFIIFEFNPNYALDFVMKAKNTIKISTHGLF